jgi:hypothetical protein
MANELLDRITTNEREAPVPQAEVPRARIPARCAQPVRGLLDRSTILHSPFFLDRDQ